MWWGAAAVALILGAAAFGLDRLGRVLARQTIGNGAAGPSFDWVLVAILMLAVMVAPVILWAGFAARVVRCWWMTALLASTAVALAFPATIVGVEVANPRPLLHYSVPAGPSDWTGAAATVLISFLVGALVHGICRWLFIRAQPQSPASCWRCGYSRAGLGEDARCPECGSSRTAELGRSAAMAMGRFGRVWLPAIVLLATAAPGVCVAVKYATGTRPALATLRRFGQADLVQATSISDWTTGNGFVGVGALRRLDDRHMLVLAIPEDRMTSLMGNGGDVPTAQLFVAQSPINGWAMRGGGWSGESVWDADAVVNLTGGQLARLAADVPAQLVEALKMPARPPANPPGVAFAKVRVIDPRPWLGE